MTVEIDIDLWLWPLAVDDVQLAALSAPLSDDEDGRARAFVRPEHARAFRVVRGRMRQILAGYTGDDPARFGFAYTPERKPWLPNGPRFNLSHSGGWAALAVTQTAPLGVDIEAHRPIEPEIAHRFFSTAENASLAGLSGDAWQAAFYRCWTRKEAFVKAHGAGLTMDLSCFDVSTAGGDAALLHLDPSIGAAKDWTMINLDLGPGMSGAIAVKTCGAPVALHLREGRMPI